MSALRVYLVFGTVNLEFWICFGIWDSVFGTWDSVHLVFGILNQGEKKANGRVARFAVSLKSVFCIWKVYFEFYHLVFGTVYLVFGTLYIWYPEPG